MDKEEPIEIILVRIENNISKVVSVATSTHNHNKYPFSIVDSYLQEYWPSLKFQLINVPAWANTSLKKTKRIDLHKPDMGWIKINFDGASKGNPNTSRA